MKKMTLTNSFHDTEVVVLVPNTCEGQQDAWEWIQLERDYANSESTRRNIPVNQIKAYRLKKRVWKALCGIDHCTCGTVR